LGIEVGWVVRVRRVAGRVEQAQSIGIVKESLQRKEGHRQRRPFIPVKGDKGQLEKEGEGKKETNGKDLPVIEEANIPSLLFDVLPEILDHAWQLLIENVDCTLNSGDGGGTHLDEHGRSVGRRDVQK
jgi:hypothetical protein